MLKMWKGRSLYGANELTCAVKSSKTLIQKNETTKKKEGENNITDELTHGEVERRQKFHRISGR